MICRRKNVGDSDLAYLEVFRSSYYAEVSLADWSTHTPPALVAQHLNVDGSDCAVAPRPAANHAGVMG